MISTEKERLSKQDMICRAKEMLELQRYSLNFIARKTGLSWKLIKKISKRIYTNGYKRQNTVENGVRDFLLWDTSIPQRCPKCGAMVKMPCIACGLSKKKKLLGLFKYNPSVKMVLGLELIGEDYTRYLQVRESKIAHLIAGTSEVQLPLGQAQRIVSG